MRTPIVSTLVLAVLLVTTGCSTSVANAGGTTPSASASGSRLRVTFVGDSIMKGHGLHASQAWPVLVGADERWRVTNLACDGAGFLAAGDDDDCGSTFSGLVDRVADTRPDVVVVQGSSNDLGQDDEALADETDEQVRGLHAEVPRARIVGLSTIWNDQTPPAQIAQTSDQVRDAVDAVGGTFVDVGQPLEGHPSWMQSDDVHPTATGQRNIAAAVERAFASAHITH